MTVVAAQPARPKPKPIMADDCRFDEQAANRPIEFIERFIRIPDPGNPSRSRPLVLMDWQKRFIRQVFGNKRADGTRRYRFAWIEVSKKNGKSCLCAALILYLLIGDAEADPEIYSAATTREQAGIIYREALKMLQRSPLLQKIIEPREHVKRLIYPKGKGFYTVLPNKPSAVDGINAHAVVFDEIHRQQRRDLYEALQYAGAARSQPLQIIITTAGDDRESIGYELHERAQNIIKGSIQDPESYVFIAAADDEDDPGDPATWRKANPSMGVTIHESELRAEYERAKDSPARMQNFRRLRLNMWVTKVSRWLDYDRWAACPRMTPRHELQGKECYGGLDLSSKYDLTAFVLQFPSRDLAGRTIHDCLGWYFLPEANIEKQERAAGVPYRAWAKEGLIELTPGDYIDYDFVKARILELAGEYDIREIAFDPAYAQQLATQLISEGLNLFEFWQRPTMTNPVLRYLESVVVEGRLRHGGNPIMNWAAGNIEVQQNADGLIKPAKPHQAKKIDPIVALAMSMGTHCKQAEQETAYTESPLILV